MAAKSDKSGNIYNVGSGKTISINRLVELLQGDSVLIPKRPENLNLHADVSLIKKDLNWSAEVSIEEGVKEILKEIEYWESPCLDTK